MAAVFISYKRCDRDAAKALERFLTSHGYSCWWDTSVVAGEHFNQAIQRELSAASCVVVLWSEASLASQWVQAEAIEGFNRKILVAARLDDVELIYPFAAVQTADLRGWRGEGEPPGLADVLRGVTAKIGVSPKTDAGLAGIESKISAVQPSAHEKRNRILALAVLLVLGLGGLVALFNPRSKAPDAVWTESLPAPVDPTAPTSVPGSAPDSTAPTAPKADAFALSALPPDVAAVVAKARKAQQRALIAAEEGCSAGDAAEKAAGRAQERQPGYVQDTTFADGGMQYDYAGEEPKPGAVAVITEHKTVDSESGDRVRFSGRQDSFLPIPGLRQPDGSYTPTKLAWSSPNGMGRVRIRKNGSDSMFCGRVNTDLFYSGKMTWSGGVVTEVEGPGYSRVPMGLGVVLLADGRREEGNIVSGTSLDGFGVIWTKDGRAESVGRFENGQLVAPM